MIQERAACKRSADALFLKTGSERTCVQQRVFEQLLSGMSRIVGNSVYFRLIVPRPETIHSHEFCIRFNSQCYGPRRTFALFCLTSLRLLDMLC